MPAQSSGSSPNNQTNRLTERIIGLGIEAHRELGPGLLESAYEECLCYEFKKNGIGYTRQKHLPVRYKNLKLENAYRIDLIVQDEIIVELKTVDKLLPLHQAQVLTYLRLSGLRIGLLMNFNTAVLKDGIKRLVL